MNRYLMKVRHFFEGYRTFEIEADNKSEALRLGKIYVCQNPIYSCGGNYDTNDVKVVKKLNKKKMNKR